VLTEGGAVYIPAGMPHAVENMVRTASAETVEIFAPLGPERVYRDPKDETGRAAFEVIHDPRKVAWPAGSPKLAAAETNKVKAEAYGPKAKRRVLFGSAAGKEAQVSLVELSPGAELPRHTHGASAELLYVLEGTGEVKVGSEGINYGPEQAFHLPDGQVHSVKATGSEPTVLLQVIAPAGEEK